MANYVLVMLLHKPIVHGRVEKDFVVSERWREMRVFMCVCVCAYLRERERVTGRGVMGVYLFCASCLPWHSYS